MRLSTLSLAVVIFWVGSQSLAREMTWAKSLLRQAKAALAVGMLVVAPVTAVADDQAAWKKVRLRPPAHHKSTFYLLIDFFDDGWRVMHTGFVGMSRDDEPLFVGPRPYLLDEDDKQKFVFRWSQISLVDHSGLVEDNVEVEEIAHFKHPQNDRYDQTLFTVKDVDLRDYEPIAVDSYPPADTELELLNYAITQDNLLRFFAYPLQYRTCNAVGNVDNEGMRGWHNCAFPEEVYPLIGPLLFNKEKQTLVAFHFGKETDAFYGVTMLPELQQYLRREMAVDSRARLTTQWGRIKVEQ